MSPVWKVAAFFAQSAAVGLAIAFLVVLFRPDLVSTVPAAGRAVASYADAVSVSAPAVATIYHGPHVHAVERAARRRAARPRARLGSRDRPARLRRDELARDPRRRGNPRSARRRPDRDAADRRLGPGDRARAAQDRSARPAVDRARALRRTPGRRGRARDRQLARPEPDGHDGNRERDGPRAARHHGISRTSSRPTPRSTSATRAARS